MLYNFEKGIDYPEWMTEESLKTLKRQHLSDNETPKEMYLRIVNTLGNRLEQMCEDYPLSKAIIDVEYIKSKWFDFLWKGWLCPSTPILSNVGTDRKFGISCYILRLKDTLDSIYQKVHEMAILTKSGGGVGITFDKIRGRGEVISTGGFSEGIIPFIKVYDSAIVAASQGNIRRGSASINLPIRHKDINEFLNIRLPIGDVNRQCLNINHCVTIDDYFMEDVIKGNQQARDIWAKVLSTRMKTGEPYIMYYHNVHNQRPDDMKKRNLKIDGSNICCLASDTEVITKEGIFKIKDLVGKEVTIYDGLQWVKCDNFTEYNEETLIRLHLKNGTHIDCTPNHRWFVANSYNDIRNNKYFEIITSNIIEGMWLEDNLANCKYEGTVNITGAYLKGFLLGDGTHISDRPLLNVHFTKYMCINALLESAKEIENPIYNTNSVKKIHISTEVINPSIWGKQQFKKLSGLTSIKKELINYCTIYKKGNEEFLLLDDKSKYLLLSGLFDADGTYSTSGIQLSSISLEFIKCIQKVLFSLGYTSNIDVSKKFPNNIYRLTIGNYDSYELFEHLSCNRLTPSEIKPNRRTTGYRQIVKIEKLNKKEKVYCPNIPTTSKFLLANGIMTGNSEILLPHDDKHSVVCDLSSLNLAKWDEWKDNDELIELSLLFLDVNLEEFIVNAKNKVGFDNVVRFAKKARALGLGVLGFHSLLQQKMLPFISIATRSLITMITKKLQKEGTEYNLRYGSLFESPEWCDENRNLTLFAIAPTMTNAIISGGVSNGIEPFICNIYAQKSAKGTFIRKNKHLEELLETKYKEYNTSELWNNIMTEYKGSVQHLDFLTDDEKEVFLTAYEINQLELIKNAVLWQKVIDQGISLNLFFPQDVDPKWLNKCHIEAWQEGIKTLYYVRTESILSKDMKSSTFDDCSFCEG
jgi:ribonucleoside-diphosphate reductase alpha chain